MNRTALRAVILTELEEHAAGVAAVEPPSSALREASYDQIDRFLRNKLSDEDYADYSQALDLIYTTAPADGVLRPDYQPKDKP